MYSKVFESIYALKVAVSLNLKLYFLQRLPNRILMMENKKGRKYKMYHPIHVYYKVATMSRQCKMRLSLNI